LKDGSPDIRRARKDGLLDIKRARKDNSLYIRRERKDRSQRFHVVICNQLCMPINNHKENCESFHIYKNWK
jgi:hypothetical protein